MKSQRALLLPLLLLLPLACRPVGESEESLGSTTPTYVREEGERSLLGETVLPVRVGELGANFAACNARGATRERAAAGGPVPVRAAPYDQAGEVDQLDPGASFFICSRSHDQRWFGIVYAGPGQADSECGVTTPLPGRRDYEGPCASGWVSSALVRLVSGVPPRQDGAPQEAPAG